MEEGRHSCRLALTQKMGRPMTDAWCSRLAALHLKHLIETGEDMEKDLVTVSAEDLETCQMRIRESKEAGIVKEQVFGTHDRLLDVWQQLWR